MGRAQELKINLTAEEREQLEKGCDAGAWTARKIKRARVLLLADTADNSDCETLHDKDIAKRAFCSHSTVGNLRKRFQENRLGALDDSPRSGRPKIVDGEVEAQMIAIACSEAPEGRERWTLKLIADRLVVLVDDLDSISFTTVGKALKKTNLNPG